MDTLSLGILILRSLISLLALSFSLKVRTAKSDED